jgi:hypothetical protein
VLKGIADALKDAGVFLMQDIAGSSHVHKNMDHPIATYLYTVSTMHCMSVSLSQGGEGLGTMWGEEVAKEMLREAGLTKWRSSNSRTTLSTTTSSSPMVSTQDRAGAAVRRRPTMRGRRETPIRRALRRLL